MNIVTYILKLQNKKHHSGIDRWIWISLRALEKVYAFSLKNKRKRDIKNQQKLSVPVISIGNITAGGTGKTPCMIRIANEIKKEGHHPAILLRGYKSQWENKGGVISDGIHMLVDRKIAGDEAYMTALRVPGVPIYIGKNRELSAKRAINDGADVILIDDGFQYWKLYRDLDILLIDGINPFGNTHLLPCGILREQLSELKRANLFILTKSDQITENEKNDIKLILKQWAPCTPIIEGNHTPKGCIALSAWKEKKYETIMKFTNDNVLLASGIGNPKSFSHTAKEIGLHPVAEIHWDDHHDYTEKDIREIAQKAKSLFLNKVIITEKDAVKIGDFSLAFNCGVDFYVLPIEMTFALKDEEILRKHWEDLL